MAAVDREHGAADGANHGRPDERASARTRRDDESAGPLGEALGALAPAQSVTAKRLGLTVGQAVLPGPPAPALTSGLAPPQGPLPLI